MNISVLFPRRTNDRHGTPRLSLIGLFLVLLSLVSTTLQAQDCSTSNTELSIHPPIAIVQGATASTVFLLENIPAAKTPLKLTHGPFVSQTTHANVPGTVVFTAGDGTGELPKTLTHNVGPPVLATISNEIAVGAAVAKVFNNGRCLGQLTAVRFDAPFNFTVEGDGSASSPLRIEDGQTVRVTLKNSDDVTYPVTPVLSVGTKESPASEITVGPNSTAIVKFATLPDWFDIRTWLRANPETAHVELRPTPSAFGNALGNRVVPGRSIAVNAQLAYFRPVRSEFVSTTVVFVVLFLGGIASLATSSLLPNILKKLSYKKRLRSLADATTSISVKVDSRLRVLLRLERNRLLKLLASSSAFATDTSDIFQQVDLGIAALTKRVTVAQRLDELRNRFDLESLSCPPSVSDKTDRHLQDAADQVRSNYLSDAMIDNANQALDAAEQILNSLGNTDALAKDIATRHKELLARTATFSAADLAPLQKDLPGIFAVLPQTYDDTHPVLPSNFMQIDDSIARVNTALDYAYVRASTTEPTIQARLSLRYSTLIQLLGTRDWRSLRAARDLVEQMRQNIYPEDLIDDLRAEQARITIDQQVARPYSPLEFCICFSRQPYNHGRALEQLSCTWTFGDSLSEKGWAVCHFYQDPGKQNITAEIPLRVASILGPALTVALPPNAAPAQAPLPNTAVTADSAQDAGATGQPVADVKPPVTSAPNAPAPATPSDRATFTEQILVRDSSSSFSRQEYFATALRFAIAFFFALVGLISGAQDQLAKLDVLPALIAVFLLGFGADTIKNILTQQTVPSTSSTGK
jgi:hypothetical protein